MDHIDPTLVSLRVKRAHELGFTAGQLRGDQWQHVAHGVVRPAFFAVDPTSARVADAVALMGRANVLGGWASLWVQGNRWFDGSDRSGDPREVLIHCLVGSQLRVRPGILPSQADLHPDEVESLGHYDVATLARSAYDEMRVARNLREAVVVLDMAVSTTSEVAHTTLAAVRRVVESHHKTRGIVQARNALELGTSRSGSPWETRTRLMAQLDVGIRGLEVNVPVFDLSENLLGVADLIEPETGLVIESDGADHRELSRHTDDNVREEKFERAGLVVCRVTSLDHVNRWATVGRINRARIDAARARNRQWTLDKPDWWTSWSPARRWA
ncbi:hypothetical protein [Aeromicrobium ginsengisoli]|uniref:DUF559 domain-containing protein n=1 Tax=Aeromicrobium ginsengisoli TaxID=363867 RepID=A0A5M4FIJ8_9ACTN|nr:hypothetical protein [Aeromicrobium ginsengisoli]KAA1400049.1 hypothetical protein ESP70_004705 [Aeromicrobium ginsengisoli]